MKLFTSLSAKISFIIVLLIMIIMASVTYVFTVRQIDSKRREVRNNMGRLAKQIASIRLAETEGWYVYQDWIDNIINSDFSRDIVYIAIFDEKDSLTAFSLNTKLLDIEDAVQYSRRQQAAIIRQLSQGLVAEESSHDFDRQPVDIRWGDEFLGKVDVGFSLIELNDAVRHSLTINLTFLAVFSIAGVLASVVISRRVTGPLNRLSNAMLGVSRGDFSQKVPIESRDEVGNLASTYNYMIEGLRQKQVIEKFSRNLAFTFELDKVAQQVTEQISQSAESEHGLLLIRRNDLLIPFWDFPNGPIKGIDPIKIRSDWTQKTENWLGPYEVEQIKQLEGFDREMARLRHQLAMKTLCLVVPIMAKEKLLSFLALGPKSNGTKYSQEEKHFIGTLAGQAAFAIENALLLEELTEQERLKRELEIARSVQMRLLPQTDPQIPGLDVYGHCIPAKEVGGDYYDYFYLDDHRLGVAVADVSGKGTSAAFYMAEIKGMMASLTKLIDSPKALLSEVNDRLYHSTDRHVFATMIYAILDVRKHELLFARAGHNALLLRNSQNSEVDFLIPPGMGLGLAKQEIFDRTLIEESRKLNPDDVLIFFTDGVSEAMTSELEEFGEARLAEIIANHNSGSMQSLAQKILTQVEQFSSGVQQHDDITMIAIRT